MSSSEHSGLASSAPCQYAPLGAYDQGYRMGFTPQGKSISGAYIVPTSWKPINHNSLIMSNGCSGYANILDAYGKDAGNCQTTYGTTNCGSK